MVLGSSYAKYTYLHVWDDFERALPAKVSIFPDDAVDVMNEDLGMGTSLAIQQRCSSPLMEVAL